MFLASTKKCSNDPPHRIKRAQKAIREIKEYLDPRAIPAKSDPKAQKAIPASRDPKNYLAHRDPKAQKGDTGEIGPQGLQDPKAIPEKSDPKA